MSICGYLQANTTVTITLGPFLDDDDGATEKTGLTIQDTDVYLSKNGGAKGAPNDTNDCTEDANGVYLKQLSTTDTNTEGILTVYCHPSDCLYVRQDYLVFAQAAYISMFTAKDAGFMDVNIKTIGRADTQETEANNLETACANYSATRGLTGTALPAAAADAAGGVPISDAGGLDLDAMNTNVSAILSDTGTDGVKLANDAITSAKFDETTAFPVKSADTGATQIARVGADGDTLETLSDQLDTITTDTNELQTDLTDGGRLDLILDAILADTNELQTDDYPTSIAAVKADTAAILTDTGTDGVAVSATAITAIWAKAMSDLAAGAPSATCSVLAAINYLYEAWRNKTETTSSEIAVYKDDGSTKLCESDISDDGTTFTKGEYGAAD